MKQLLKILAYRGAEGLLVDLVVAGPEVGTTTDVVGTVAAPAADDVVGEVVAGLVVDGSVVGLVAGAGTGTGTSALDSVFSRINGLRNRVIRRWRSVARACNIGEIDGVVRIDSYIFVASSQCERFSSIAASEKRAVATASVSVE